jgi:hypothetical protein
MVAFLSGLRPATASWEVTRGPAGLGSRSSLSRSGALEVDPAGVVAKDEQDDREKDQRAHEKS